MNVLIIGGCHVANYGLQPQLGFVQQWINQIEINLDEPVNVTSLSMVKLSHIGTILTQYQPQLEQANFIVLQLGHYELSWRKRFSELFQAESKVRQNENTSQEAYRRKTLDRPTELAPSPLNERLKNRLKASLLTAYQRIHGPIPYLAQFSDQLTNAFNELRYYRSKVVILTPFPTFNEVDQWLRRAAYPLICRQAQQAGFALIDTFDVVPRRKAFFLPDGIHLNQLGHLTVAFYLANFSGMADNLAEQVGFLY